MSAKKKLGPQPRFKRTRDVDLEYIIEDFDHRTVLLRSEEFGDGYEIEMRMPIRRFPIRVAKLRGGEIVRFTEAGKPTFSKWWDRPHQRFISQARNRRFKLVFAGPAGVEP